MIAEANGRRGPAQGRKRPAGRGWNLVFGVGLAGVILGLAACNGDSGTLNFMKAEAPGEGYAQPAVYPDPEAETAEGGSNDGINYGGTQYDGNDEIVNGKCLPDHPVSYCFIIEGQFKQPLRGLNYKDRARFLEGNRVFNANWVPAPMTNNDARDGLGPMFDARSCARCHVNNGRGRPPRDESEALDSMILRISIRGDSGRRAEPHPVYGEQFNVHAIDGSRPEGRVLISYRELPGRFADGETFSVRQPRVRFADLAFGPLGEDIMISPRIAPLVIGLGLVESVEEKTILELADPNDADGDGISGRANFAIDPLDGERKLSRFGWKAAAVSLRHQTTAALAGDMGITSGVYPAANCPGVAPGCLGISAGGSPEIRAADLEDLILYMQLISPTVRRGAEEPAVAEGEEIFESAGCASCHTPRMVTGRNDEVPLLSNLVFYPYSDFLLHDMGEGLADGRPEAEADGREWRTPPLWGLGYTEQINAANAFYLHDGRARSLMEALLWHGGEAAASRQALLAMPKAGRKALIAFLESL